MLDTIPVHSIEFQRPKNVCIPGNVVELTIRVFEPEGKIIIRKVDLPSDQDLIHQGFMYTFECSTNKTVGVDGLSNGEEHMSEQPGVTMGWFL